MDKFDSVTEDFQEFVELEFKNLLHRVQHWLLPAVFLILCTHAICSEDPADIFPTYGLKVKSNQTTSGILELSFSNVAPVTVPDNTQPLFNAAYQIAGPPNRIPSLTVHSMRFFRFLGDTPAGYVTFTTHTLNTPVSQVKVTKSGILRSHQLYTLTFPIKQLKTVQGTFQQETLLLDQLKVCIDLGKPDTKPTTSTQSFVPLHDTQPDRLFLANVLNPNIDSAFAATTPTQRQLSDWSSMQNWVDLISGAIRTGDKVDKFLIDNPGAFRIPQSRPGYNHQAFFFHGQPLSILHSPVTTNTGILVIPEYDTVQVGQEVIWRISSNRAEIGAYCLPLTPKQSSLPATPLPDSETTVSIKQSFEEYIGYHPRLTANADVTRWFWQTVTENKTTVFNFDLPKDLSEAAQSSTSLLIYGQPPDPVSGAATVFLTLNGKALPNEVFNSQTKLWNLNLPPGMMIPGKNTLTMRLKYPESAEGKSDLLIQKISVAAPAPLSLIFDNLTSQPHTFTFPDNTFNALLRPSLVNSQSTPTLVTSKTPTDAILPVFKDRFAMFELGGQQKNSFFFLPDNPPVLSSPVEITTFSLLQSPPANVAFIYPKEFRNILQLLAEYRSKHGWQVNMYDLETIYDHFSFGAKSPEAIRSFLGWSFYNMQGPKLQAALLVGEAGDYRLPKPSPSAPQPDLLPVNGGPRSNEARGDQEYSLIAGDDNIVDLAVGRISVKNEDELKNVIDKMVTYESAPSGLWSLDAIFAYDDNDEFPSVVSEVMRLGAAPMANILDMPQDKYYYRPNSKVTYRRRANGATEELIAAFNRGAGMVNYFGHGGPNLWSHERMLHISDLALIKNTPHIPFITCSSCDTTWFDYPIQPVSTSIGEAFLKHTQGGAVGVFASVSGASPYEHKGLMSALNIGIWKQGIRQVGVATAYAKNLYHANTNSFSLGQQFALVGDPLLMLNSPRPSTDLRNFQLLTDRILSTSSTPTIKVQIDTPDSYRTVIRVRSSDGVTIKDVTIPDIRTTKTVDIALPRLKPGRYSVECIPTDKDGDILDGYTIAPLDVITPWISLEYPENMPVQLKQNETTTVEIHVSNLSPVLLCDTSLSLSELESTGAKITGTANFDLQPEQDVSVHIPMTGSPNKQYILYLTQPQAMIEKKSMTIPMAVMTDTQTTAPYLLEHPDFLSVTPEFPEKSSYARVLVKVINPGDLPLSNTSILLSDNSNPQNQRTEVPVIAGGTSLNCPISLNTLLPEGDNVLHLDLVRNDTGTTLSSITTGVAVPPAGAPKIINGSLRLISQTGTSTANETMFLHAKVINPGPRELRGITVEILKDSPTAGIPQQTNNDQTKITIGTLKPNETKSVKFRWENFVANSGENYYLVLNRMSVSPHPIEGETWTTVPALQSTPLGDYTVPELSLGKNLARPGEYVLCTPSVSFTGQAGKDSPDMAFGLYNPATSSDKLEKTAIPPFTGITSVTQSVKMASGYPFIRVNINASRELAEENPSNNIIDRPVTLLFNSEELEQHKDQLSFAPLLTSFKTVNVELIPGLGYRLLDKFASSTGLLEIQPSLVVNTENAETSQAMFQTDKTDKKWLVLPWLARAWPSENAGILHLKYNIPGSDNRILYEVRALVLGGQDYEGRPVGAFQCKLTSDSAFKRYDTSTVQTLSKDTWITLGNTKLMEDGTFQPQLKQVGDATAFVKGFELKPLQATLTTPAILFNENVTFTPKVISDFPQELVMLRFRNGRINPQGDADWNDWQDIPNGHPVQCDKDAPLTQWSIYLRPDPSNPEAKLRDLILVKGSQTK